MTSDAEGETSTADREMARQPQAGVSFVSMDTDDATDPARKVRPKRLRTYRYSDPKRAELQVTAQTARGTLDVTFVEALDDYVEIAIPRWIDAAFPVGETLLLNFVVPSSRLHIALMARVQGARAAVDSTSYSLMIEEPEEALEDLERVLANVFDRRRTPRFALSDDPPVGIVLEAGPESDGTTVIGYAVDISTRGIGIKVPRIASKGLRNVFGVTIHMSLPGVQSPVRLNGMIRNGSLEEDELRYGIEFCADDADEMTSMHAESLTSFVMRVSGSTA